MTVWAFLRHPDTGGAHLVPADSAWLFETRGWVRHDMPEGLDADDPYAPASLDELLELAANPKPIPEPVPVKPEPKKPSKKAEPSATEKKE
jgi:hypothetical protein